MDFTKLIEKPAGPNLSGNYTQIYFILKEWALTIPNRDTGDPHLMSSDIVLKTGRAWVPLYSTKDTTNLEETGSELPDNDAATSVFKMKTPFDIWRREFVAKYGKKDMLLLIQKCGVQYPILLGDACTVVNMFWKKTEGTKAGEENLAEFTFNWEGAYVSVQYRGTIGNQNIFAADDATPSVAGGTEWFTSNANTAETTITDLDDANVGAKYTILGGGGDEDTKIVAGGNFSLAGDVTWVASVGSAITFFVRGAGDFVELGRS
jgi:hypothetical protein